MRDLAIIFRERLEHGIEGIDLNFEFKMASSTKCRTYSGRVITGKNGQFPTWVSLGYNLGYENSHLLTLGSFRGKFGYLICRQKSGS